MVFKRIFQSRATDQLSMYSRSSSIHRLKFRLFRPSSAHRQVRPGGMRSLRRCQPSYFSTSSGKGGRGPTNDMSPFRILMSCGSSSRLNLRMNFPTAVRRGSSLILNRSEEHTSELQSPCNLVCRLLLEKKKTT